MRISETCLLPFTNSFVQQLKLRPCRSLSVSLLRCSFRAQSFGRRVWKLSPGKQTMGWAVQDGTTPALGSAVLKELLRACACTQETS